MLVWDETKNRENQRKHGVSFEEAGELFTAGVDYLELFDDAHSDAEDRVHRDRPDLPWRRPRRLDRARRADDPPDQCPPGDQARAGAVRDDDGANPMTDIPELTASDFERAIPASLRQRLMRGEFTSGDDVVALRRFIGLTQAQLATAMGISVHTLRNWEQGRRRPEGPAVALLRIAARHPRIIRESLKSAA
jgi:DNA-binding transcriptional regulator YiaG